MAINYENNNITGSGSLFINNSGNFASGLYVNNIPVSLSGHSHSLKIGDGFTDQISYLSSDRLNIVGTGGTLISFNDSLNTITISGAPNLTNVVFTTGNQNISGIKTFFDKIVVTGEFSSVSGYFRDLLQLNGTGVSLSGHSHSISDITNFGSGFSGLLPLTIVYTTGNQFISGVKTFLDNMVSSGQISAPSGKFDYIVSDKDFTINGTLNINAAASILASGPITFVGNPYVVSGAGYFTSGLFVGSTGSATAVSLSGHRQSYSTIDNFCTGVAECVNTPLLAGTGISLSYVNGTGLYINASGIQILSSSSGFVVKTGINNYTTRLISNGNNINISYADGISANPIIELSGSLDLIKDITSTGNLKAISGIFSSGITLNGTGVSLVGHGHSISDITDLQTTLNGKQSSLTNPITGTGTNGQLSKWSSTSTLSNSILSESSNIINVAGSFNGQSDDTYLSFDANARRIGITKKNGFIGKFTYGSGSSFAIAQSSSGTIEATNTFTDRLVIDNIGNIGIGTSSPNNRLHVNGTGLVDGRLSISPATAVTSPLSVVHISGNVTDNGSLMISGPLATRTYLGVGNSDTIPFLSTLGGNISTSIYGWGFFDRGTDGYLHIQRKGGTSSWLSVMMMDRSNGNVGIGTGIQATTPPEKLTVDGNIRVADTSVTQGNIVQLTRGGGGQYDYSIGKYSTALAISLSNDSSTQRPLQVGYHSGTTFLPQFHVNGYNGSVGIGTTNPSTRLEVAASGTTDLDIAHFSNRNGVEKAKISLSSNGDGTLSLIDGNNSTNIFLSSSSTSNSYINGKVGIGTTTPSGQLHVVGSGFFASGLAVTGLITSNSGNFINSLQVNGTGVSLIGHTHSVSNITDFNSSVSGLLSNVVYTTGDQNIGGVKTFTSGFASNLSSNFYLNNSFNNSFKINYGTSAAPYGTINIIPSGTNPGTTNIVSQFNGTNTLYLPSSNGNIALISDINTTQITGILSVSKGGTNTSTYSNGQLLIGSGTTLAANTLTQGDGITITNGSGTISLAINHTVVRTSSNQTVSGVKTFANQSNFSSGIKLQGNNVDLNLNSGGISSTDGASITITDNLNFLSANTIFTYYSDGGEDIRFYDGDSASDVLRITDRVAIRSPNGSVSGTYFPVWTSNPNSSAQPISSKTASEFKNDIGLGNVENIALSSANINTSQISGVLPISKGGTNTSTYSNGQLLIGSGTSLIANTLTASTGISIINDSGTITIATTGLANYDVSILSLGTISGSNAINCGQDRQIQNLTLNGVATTFTKGNGWPTSDFVARETTLNIFSSGNTSVTWTIVNDWYRQPDSPLPSGRHIVLLRSIGSGTMQGHYIGNKSN